jgi:hypothetical protein
MRPLLRFALHRKGRGDRCDEPIENQRLHPKSRREFNSFASTPRKMESFRGPHQPLFFDNVRSA